MAKGIYYCEECVEEISGSDVYWEGSRAYCGQCGSELDTDDETADVVEHMSHRKLVRPVGTDYDEGDEEEEEDALETEGLDDDEAGDEDEEEED
jgi:hypothetical protein